MIQHFFLIVSAWVSSPLLSSPLLPFPLLSSPLSSSPLPSSPHQTCCHSPWIRRHSLLSNISTLPFFFPPPLSSSLAGWPPCLLALSPLSSGPGPSWPCPPWVIYHGPGREPLGLQAPVSPCNRLFVAPSKQVSDQQKSIKAWWAFLSQLGSGHWAALRAAPRALCVAAVRWHRSPQD